MHFNPYRRRWVRANPRPVGLKELTSYKYVIHGEGQIREE